MATNGHGAMSDLSPLSGVKWKLNFGAVRAAFDSKQSCSGLSGLTRLQEFQLALRTWAVRMPVICRLSRARRLRPEVALDRSGSQGAVRAGLPLRAFQHARVDRALRDRTRR